MLTISALQEISKILNTGLDPETLSLCLRLCESGVNPEALALVIKELRRESAAVKVIITPKQQIRDHRKAREKCAMLSSFTVF